MLRCIVMGAAGRDFHDFLTFFRDRDDFRVVAFTAAQIPFIAQRTFPQSLAGPRYSADVPIFPETELPRLIRELDVDFVFLAYSDLSHAEVMHKASLVQSCGAAFAVLGPKHTQLVSRRPVISVTAVRTGAGKSPLTRALAMHLRDRGRKVAALRHPMPYGDLSRQRVQRFATEADLDRAECTIEEREEYEPYVEAGLVVFAGVDYRAILAQAEAEADVLLWDGGNNDYPFLEPNLSLVLADALRPGHEDAWYPGETNLRAADVVLINKVSQAKAEDVARIERTIARLAPKAVVLHADLEVSVDPPRLIEGRRVLVVEDGPTVTHGGMGYGAGLVAARAGKARELIDPRPFAVGTLAQAYRDFPHLGPVLPALGYSEAQRRELEQTIARSGAEVLVDASPARLDRALSLMAAVTRVEPSARPELVEGLHQTRRRTSTSSARTELANGSAREPPARPELVEGLHQTRRRASTSSARTELANGSLRVTAAITLPVARVSYRFVQRSGPSIFALVDEALSKWRTT